MDSNRLVNADLQLQRKQLEEKLMGIHKKSMEIGNKKVIIWLDVFYESGQLFIFYHIFLHILFEPFDV